MVPPEAVLIADATAVALAPWVVTAWVAAWANWSVRPLAAAREVAAATTCGDELAMSWEALVMSPASRAAAATQERTGSGQ